MTEIPSTADYPERSRQDATRLANDRIALSAESHRFDRDAAVPFMCECDDALCTEFVPLTQPEYGTARRRADVFTVPGHTVAGARLVQVTREYALFRLG